MLYANIIENKSNNIVKPLIDCGQKILSKLGAKCFGKLQFFILEHIVFVAVK